MKKIFLFLIVSVLIIASCSKNPDVGGTAAQKVANEWWVQVDGNGHFGKLITSNTSANNDSIWIYDVGTSVWDFKVKAKVDYTNLTFATNAKSIFPGYNINVKITDGKVLPGLGHSKTGDKTDSIYMKMEFSDDPGTIYTVTGHARTKFAEDEY